MITALVLVPAGLLLAVLALAARLASRRCRVHQAAGGPSVSPARPSPAGETAAPAVADPPDLDGRTAFAYDNGLKVGEGGKL